MTKPERIKKDELFENCRRISENGIDLSNRIKKAAKIEGDKFAYTQALKIYLCSSKKNTWVAEELGKSGTVREANFSGRLFKCGSAICPGCSRKTICRNRRRAIDAVTGTVVPENENWRLITLTMPRIKVNYNKALKIFFRAWDLLRKRKFFLKNVSGGIKSIEPKLSKTRIWHHLHMHLLAVTNLLKNRSLRKSGSNV